MEMYSAYIKNHSKILFAKALMLRNHINADGVKHELFVVRINDWAPEYFKHLDPFLQSHLHVSCMCLAATVRGG